MNFCAECGRRLICYGNVPKVAGIFTSEQPVRLCGGCGNVPKSCNCLPVDYDDEDGQKLPSKRLLGGA